MVITDVFITCYEEFFLRQVSTVEKWTDAMQSCFINYQSGVIRGDQVGGTCGHQVIGNVSCGICGCLLVV